MLDTLAVAAADTVRLIVNVAGGDPSFWDLAKLLVAAVLGGVLTIFGGYKVEGHRSKLNRQGALDVMHLILEDDLTLSCAALYQAVPYIRGSDRLPSAALATLDMGRRGYDRIRGSLAFMPDRQLAERVLVWYRAVGMVRLLLEDYAVGLPSPQDGFQAAGIEAAVYWARRRARDAAEQGWSLHADLGYKRDEVQVAMMEKLRFMADEAIRMASEGTRTSDSEET